MNAIFTNEQISEAARKVSVLKGFFTDDDSHLISNALLHYIDVNMRMRKGANWRDARALVPLDQPKPCQHSPASSCQDTDPSPAPAEGAPTPPLVIHLYVDSNQVAVSAPSLAPQTMIHSCPNSVTETTESLTG